MSSKFECKKEYALGNDEIDPQHKQLLSYARKFERSSSKDEALASLMEVYRYTREHFITEESYMKSINFEGYQDHRSCHDKLIKKFNSLVLNFDNSDTQRADILIFLEDWVIVHIATEDKKINDFAKHN